MKLETSIVVAVLTLVSATDVRAQTDEDASALFFDAIDAYGAGDFARSLTVLDQAEKQATDSLLLARIHRQRGLAEGSLQRNLAAVKSFMRAMSYRPDIRVTAKEHTANLVALFVCAARIRARGIPESEVSRAYSDELERAKWVCPIKEGSAVTEKDRRLARAHDAAARQLEQKGDLEGAVAEMVLALGFDRAPEYLDHLAQIYAAKGDLPNAIRYAKEYARAAPKSKRAAIEQRIKGYEEQERVRLASGAIALEVDVVGAEVRIDGAKHGRTPLPAITLPVGSHDLELTAPDYLPYTARVVVESTKTKTVRVQMIPRPRMGTLVIAVAEPRAIVRVDGQDFGVGPMQKSIVLLVGTHEIVVHKEPEYLPFTKSVEIEHEETTNLLVQLKPVPEIAPPSAWGWVLLASAGALAGGGAVVTFLAIDERKKIDSATFSTGQGAIVSLQQVDAQAAEDRADLYSTVALGLFAGAGAAVVIGTLVAIFSGGDPIEVDTDAGVRAQLFVSPGASGVAVRF